MTRTRSTLAGLHTPVTSAPYALAIWTANVPTPPDAPMISTFCPACTCARSRTAWSAARAETGTAAAWSKERFAGLGASRPARVRAYSAKAAVAGAEDLIARLELRHVLAGGVHHSGHAPARIEVLGLAEPEARRPDGIGQAGHDVPGAPIHAGRTHPYQDLVVADGGCGDMSESEHVLGRGSVPGLDDRRHRHVGGGGRGHGRGLCRWVERCCLHGLSESSLAYDVSREYTYDVSLSREGREECGWRRRSSPRPRPESH